MKQCLYGHTEAVTCLAASPAYNVVVSGSRDGTAIVWDLSRCLFVRQLTGHTGPISAVTVNDLTVSLSIMCINTTIKMCPDTTIIKFTGRYSHMCWNMVTRMVNKWRCIGFCGYLCW